MILELIFGLFCFILMCLFIGLIVVLIGDMILIKYETNISWRESIRCGWLYFIDRFKK